MATFPYTGFPDGQAYPSIPTGTTVVNVVNSAALTTALTNATAGQRIVLANGTYSGGFTLSGKNGTATSGITIEAATTGGAVFASGSTINVNNSSYVTIKGLSAPYELSSGNLVQFRGTSHHCRITRCLFGPTAVGTSGANKTPFVYLGDDCDFIRIDHNEFRNKANPGNTILGDGNFTTFQVVKHIRIDHNILRSIKPEVTNEKEPIRLGVSTMSKTNSYSVIERNFFTDCICEPEIVSAKAGNIRITGNTVLRSIGGLVYRHGLNGIMSDNYIVDRVDTFGSTIGSGGIRFYDANHEVSYNYVDGVFGGNFQGPLVLDTGDAEGSSTALDAHWRVVNALVERNVLVGNPEGIRIGDNYDSAPTGCTIRDNIVAQTPTGVAITQRIAPVSSTLTNNTYYATPATGGLAQGNDTIWRKSGFGPRLTYLQQGDVGVTGDPNDTDGTGTLISGGTTPPPDPIDATTAAGRLGWGSPLPQSDEFEYTGAPTSTKWSVYNGPGHDGNGVRSPARVTVANGKMVLTGLAGSASTAGLAHKLDQQYGRWEVRCRSFYTTGGGAITQSLGVGGVATPPGAILATSDQAGTALTITTSGTASNPRVLDGQGKKIGRVTFDGCQYVVVQNYLIQSGNQYGVVFDDASNCTLQNCDISNVRNSGDGDLNAITVWGGTANKIKYNTAINFVGGAVPAGSHTDWLQTWVSSSHPNAATNYEIVGNRAIGPANPSRDNSIASIHQWIMVEGAGRGGNSGGSGNPSGWFVAENEVGDSWNQAVKLDGGNNFTFTRNKFVGDSDKVFDLPSASGVKIYADNVFGSGYGSVGGTVTAGAGPPTPGGSTSTPSDGGYHPVLIVWPTDDQWPESGEYDFLENGEPGEQAAGAFLHYPSLDGANHQIDVADYPVDLTQFHNFAFEWTPDGLKGWVDGNPWFSHSGGAASDRKALQAMPSGHLTVQLDAFQATGLIASTFEIEWARVYSLTPSGPPAGPQTVSAVGIASAEAFGTALVTGAAPAPPPGSVQTSLGVNSVLGSSTLGFTAGTGTPPPAGNQTVSGVGGIPTAQAFGLPVITLADGPQTVVATGIGPATTFGRPQVTIGAAPGPAPGGVLVPTLFAVSRDGVTLTPLPAWTKISLSPVRSSAGSLSVEYPAGAPGFPLLHDGVSASPLRALEIRVWLGGNATGALGGWLVQKSGNDLIPGSTWTFTGHFHEWLLDKAIIAPQAISEANKSGALSFAGATAGLILATAMDQAQARGALPLVTRDFTTTHDSNGAPWAKAISSLKLAPKTTLLSIANKLVDLDMCEYEFTAGRVFRAFNPGGQGTDRTTGPTPLTFAHAVNLSEHARRESARDAGTAVLVAGAEGFYEFASSPTAQAQLGWRAEVGVDAGQLDSRAAVQAVAPSYLETASAGVAEYNSAVEFGPGAPIPLIDYAVGDWAYTTTGNTRKRLRIAQIELDFAVGEPPRGKVVQNDLITDRLTALYRRLNAISTGDAVVGTSESTPGGPGEDINPPAAPTGVTVASTFAYQVPGDATTYAEVGVGWAPVITNAYADDATAAKVRAAELIAARMRGADGIADDWTWPGMPTVVTDNGKAVLDEWKAFDGDTSVGHQGTDVLTWLDAYPAAHLGGGAVTTDVAQYVVQFQYLGVQGTGFFDPRNPDPDDRFWATPDGSPTPRTLLVFGGITGGRGIGVRVAAVDNAGNQGPWSATVATETASDDTPPPAPSKPTVAAGFRLIRVTWDGKGSSGEDMVAAAPDFLSGGGVEIHVAQGIDFTPDRPFGANGKVDLSLSQTYQATLYDAMTYPVNGLTNGVTYFVRFVSTDRTGNASDPSETSDGVTPQQLVTIDYGPDTIDRATIRAAAIGSAEIDLLAVNESHIGSVNASSITSGVVDADLINAGRFATPVSSTGNQLEFDSNGIRLRQGGTVVGRWQVFDASMLVTGQYQTAMLGQRVVLNPGASNPDTIRFYPTFTDAYSSIDSVDFNSGTVAGIRIVGSGTSAVSNRGMVLVRDQYASLVHGRTDLSYWGSEIWIEQSFTRNKSAAVDLIIDERLTPVNGPRRVAMICYNTAGQPINATGLYYQKTAFNGGEPQLYANGQDCALVFAPDGLKVRNNPNGDWRDIWYGTAHQMSGRATKRDIRDLDADPVHLLRHIGAKQYRLHRDADDAPERMGFIAEDMPRPVRVTSVTPATEDGEPDLVAEAIDYSAVTALLWAATQRIEQRLSTVERRLPVRRGGEQETPEEPNE